MEEQLKEKARIGATRLAWIDVAKGITILLVVVGHTAPFGSTMRNYVFSFHMPLFFILSGYTAKSAKSAKEYVQHIIKNFCKLILPCVCVEMGRDLLYAFPSLLTENGVFWSILKRGGETLGSGRISSR
jgi:fucose 4-O-acetylase-like acetyltransferase